MIEIVSDQIDGKSYIREMPGVNDSKERIVTWIGFWPVSLVLTVLDGLFEKFAVYLRDVFLGVYESIERKMSKGIERHTTD